jgi:hypothetical protein
MLGHHQTVLKKAVISVLDRIGSDARDRTWEWRTYAAWIDNAVDTDVDQIRRSMGIAPNDPGHVVRATAPPAARADLSSAPSFRSRFRKLWQQFGQHRERITVQALLFSHQLVRSVAC